MNKRGFTLVEIMIVIAVIALIAAIGLPNLLRMRTNANEGAAISNMKTLSTAVQSYWGANNVLPTTLSELTNSNPPYVDTVLGCGQQPCAKNGYSFAITGTGTSDDFEASAVAQPGQGKRSFCVVSDGVIHVDVNGSAIDDYETCTNLPVL